MSSRNSIEARVGKWDRLGRTSAIRAGASGYLLKDAPREQLAHDWRTVANLLVLVSDTHARAEELNPRRFCARTIEEPLTRQRARGGRLRRRLRA
jgi:DNA-binding NarL/FixJ family response regulator